MIASISQKSGPLEGLELGQALPESVLKLSHNLFSWRLDQNEREGGIHLSIHPSIHMFNNSWDLWDHSRKEADLVPALLETTVEERVLDRGRTSEWG